MDEIGRLRKELDECHEALSLLMDAFDAMLPGVRHIPCDIGLLNDAACKARPIVDKYLSEKA